MLFQAQRAMLGYRPALDGVRGVAIGLVIAVHAGLLRGGGLGVDLFFVLSGFLITISLLEEEEHSGRVSLGAFYVRRACRLGPGLALLVAAYLAYAIASGKIGDPAHVVVSAAIGLGYVENFFLASSSPVPAHYLWHLWSLAQEEQFYLVWPFLLLTAVRRRVTAQTLLKAIALLVVAVTIERWALVATGASNARIWFGPDTNLDTIMVGSAAGIAWTNGMLKVTRRAAAISLALAVFAVAGVPEFADGQLLTTTAPTYGIACALLIVFLVDNGSSMTARVLTVRPLRYLGKISYGVYLWHFPLMHFAGVPGGLILTAIVAPVSYRYVETPIRRWGRAHAARTPPRAPTSTLATSAG